MNAPPVNVAPPDDAATRNRARQIVAELAERLGHPDRIAVPASAPGGRTDPPDTPAPRLLRPGPSLGEGHSGIALLHAELSHAMPEHRTFAHAHLAAALSQLPALHGGGLHGGVTSLAFAAQVARHHRPRSYTTLLDQLDERVLVGLHAVLESEAARLDAGRAGVAMHTYDTISGVTGVGRYLLLRAQDRHRQPLAGLLSYLVRLCRPVRVHGADVPGWWVPTGPSARPDPRFPHGHFNIGVAHGMCGPLALLALCHEAGVLVPGQSEAIHQLAEHILAFRLEGGRWPRVVAADAFIADAFTADVVRADVVGDDAYGDEAFVDDVIVSGTARPSGTPGDTMAGWCYGTAGVARALHLAGRALGEPAWRHAATRALTDTLLALTPQQITDGSLCHGWAGLLHATSRMAGENTDGDLVGFLPRLARRLTDAYDPGLPFGFTYDRPAPASGRTAAPHRAGFLEGAAGIALALHAYGTGGKPSSPWDAALLLD
ncbi:lanthionine synthetase C family protein [Streptomyces sp. MST-110588]|uniref:lanthionine synthetase C family protein n=1 Tax=Streptomyces sp. MST-110588 TaxID=2833628 RepID=UPI001F5C86E3|nr:lanthionine synthetase C family protein [Streptomyces sp. MST-110588]UNO39508.1 lanthionine synthetase C family protein [Streptomyces sp. MST-110588]